MLGQGTDAQIEKLMEDAKNFGVSDCDGLRYQERLQVGAAYFVTTNIDVSDGLFNGALGVLQKIDYGTIKPSDERIPTCAWMKFRCKDVGASKRAANRARYNRQDIEQDWIPIDRLSKVLSKSYMYAGLQLIRNQIPLVGANAMTIHKSQGSSLPQVVVSVKKALQRDQLYVACSRATSLAGLYIDGDFQPPKRPGDDDHVSAEMDILRAHTVSLSFRFPIDVCTKYKLYFHNVENFNCYKADVISDPNILSATFIAMVEPKILQTEDLQIPNFDCLSKGYCQVAQGGHQRNSEGHLFYKSSGDQFFKLYTFLTNK